LRRCWFWQGSIWFGLDASLPEQLANAPPGALLGGAP
jgi:hypothetical protein